MALTNKDFKSRNFILTYASLHNLFFVLEDNVQHGGMLLFMFPYWGDAMDLGRENG